MSDFDDMFRKGLYDHKVDVPDDLWSRIDQEVNPKKKFRKAFVLSVIGLLVFSIAGYLYYSIDDENTIQQKEIQSTPTIKATQDSDDVLRDYLLATSEIESHEADLSNINAYSLTSNWNIENTQEATQSATSSKTSASSKNIYIAEPKTSAIKTADNNQSSLASVESQKQIVLQDVEIAELQSRQVLFENLEIKLAEPKFDWSLKALPEYDKKCPRFGNSKTGFFSIEAYHSSDRILKELKPKSSEDENYAELRADSESQLYSFSNGIGVTWHHTDGIGIGLGVERSQINELFSFVEQDAREVRVLITLDTLFNTDGTFTTSIDTTRIEVLGVKKNYVSNQYTSIDLPISLSYRWDRKRWGVGVRGAVYLNLLFNQKGRVLGINGKPAWITEGSENELDAYRAKSGLKFDGSIDVTYHLTHMWDVYMQPYFRYNGNTYTRDNYQLDHFVNTMGIRAGIRYNFGF